MIEEAEREFEPQISAATDVLDGRRKKYNAAKGLITETKSGMSLLLHLTLGETHRR